MKRLLATLLLLTVALPAWGATYWVRDAQTGAHTGADSSNAISLATFNSTAVAGDVALLVGVFTATAPNPANSGTIAAPIVYRGCVPGAQTGAIIGGTRFYFAGTTPDSNVLYRDFTVYTSGGSSFGFYNSDETLRFPRYRFANITFTGAIGRLSRLSDSRFDSCTFNVQQFIIEGANYHTLHNYRMAERDSLISCTVNITHDGSNAEANSGPSLDIATVSQHYYKRTRFNDYISLSGTKGMLKVYYTQRSLIEDCYFDLYSTRDLTGAACDECNTSYFRDSTQYNNWNRDTIYIHGPYQMAFLMNASGSLANSNRGNRFDSCLIVRDAPAGGTGENNVSVGWYDTPTASDTISNCVFVNGNTSSVPIRANLWGASAVFDHNTVVQLGGGGQAQFYTMSGAAKITNNIFYSDSGAYSGLGGSAFAVDGATSAVYDGDTNLFYSANASSGSIYAGGSPYSPGSGGTACATFAEECASRRGNPFFVGGASAIAFDASLTAGSAALFGSDGYVGARSFSAGTDYTITVTQGAHGSISPSGTVHVASGGSQTFTITPDAHYHTTAVTVDGSGVGVVTSYAFTNVTGNHTITATYAIDTNNITSSAGANGSISPSGVTAVNYGASRTYTFTPDANYHVASLTVDGVSVATADSYTFTNVTTTHTIAVTFSQDTYYLYAQAYPNGTISPSGTISVAAGDYKGFSITPDAGYRTTDVLVDGASVGAVTFYSFSGIAASHTIEAYFAAVGTHSIVATQSAGGTIAPSGTVSVADGGSQTFTITPDYGYEITSVVVDGVSVTITASYTFTNVTSDHTITARFTATPPTSPSIITILSNNTNYGRVSAGATVDYDGFYQVIATPFRGYYVGSLKLDGIDLGSLTSLALRNVTAPHAVSVTFAPGNPPGAPSARRRR